MRYEKDWRLQKGRKNRRRIAREPKAVTDHVGTGKKLSSEPVEETLRENVLG